MSKKIADSYPEKEEILQYLLAETGQYRDHPTKADTIIEFLKLRLVSFDFAELDNQKLQNGRAILSYNQRAIAINSNISEHKINFSKFHEIAHYVLPNHVEKFYFCDNLGMSMLTKSKFEAEANSFAADLIYKGDIFSMESNSMRISFTSIMLLQQKYGSTIESTARRFVERSIYPCLFLVYEKGDLWKVRYCIFSRPFLEKYLQSRKGSLSDDNNEDVIRAELQQNEIIESECRISIKGDREEAFDCEYFNNGYNTLALIKEKE